MPARPELAAAWRSFIEPFTSRRLSQAAGLFAASVIFVTANILAARNYTRWDWTSSGAYTLSAATQRIVTGLSQPVEVVVFLSRSDRLSIDVRHMLTAYRALSPRIEPRFVDPDTNPAEFSALQQKFGVVAGKSEDGRIVTDASLVVARGNRHHFVTLDDLLRYDESGEVQPRLEQALTEAIADVQTQSSAKACFTSGQQEISIDDMAPHGLAELRRRLEKSNFEVTSVDLTLPNISGAALEGCHLVVIAGPEVPFSKRATKSVVDYYGGGGSVLLLANPMVDADSRLVATGLEPIAAAAGVELEKRYVIERDPEWRLPQGIGEAFFANPLEHAATSTLMRGPDKVDFRVLLIAPQSLERTSGSTARPLLTSSKDSFAVGNLRDLQRSGSLEKRPADASGPFQLAMASEAKKSRMLVVGTANVVWSQNWRDPALLGARLFVENAISWLTARPPLVSVPEKPARPAGVALTEASLAELSRYVLIYMPGTALLLGVLVMFRRRRSERPPERTPNGPAASRTKRSSTPDDTRRRSARSLARRRRVPSSEGSGE